jgi:hypothetical protein
MIYLILLDAAIYHQQVPGVKAAHILTYEDQDGDWMMVGDVPWEYVSALFTLFNSVSFFGLTNLNLFLLPLQAIPDQCKETKDHKSGIMLSSKLDS